MTQKWKKLFTAVLFVKFHVFLRMHLKRHLAGMKHAYKANREKYTWKASKGSEVELNIEAKAENIELVDVRHYTKIWLLLLEMLVGVAIIHHP